MKITKIGTFLVGIIASVYATVSFAQTPQQDSALLGSLKAWVQGAVPGGGGSSPNVFFVADYATCDGSTDDTAALQTLASDVRSAVNGVIEFPQNEICIFSSSPSVGVASILNVSGTNGVTINFNGSCLHSPGTYTGGRFIRVIEAVSTSGSTKNLTVNGYCAKQTTSTSASQTDGLQGFYFQDSVQGVIINGAYQQYGNALFQCTRSAGLAKVNRARGVWIHNADSDNVYYGISLTKNCDQTAVNLVSTNNARSVIVHGVGHFRCRVDSAPGSNTAQDMSLGVIALSTETAAMNTLSDVDCSYISNAQTASHSASTWLFAQYDTNAAAAHIRNVRIHLDVSIATAANTPIGFMLTKQVSGVGSCVTATLGNTLENVTVTGSMVGFANNVDPVQLGQCGTWNGETVRNVRFVDVTTTGSGSGVWDIDGTGLGSITFERVVSAHNIAVANQGAVYICRQATWSSTPAACGYRIQSTVLSGAAVALTNSTPANITSMVLLPGRYTVCAAINTNMNVATQPTEIRGAINTTSATFPTPPADMGYLRLPIPGGVGQNYNVPVGCVDADLTTATTYYLIGQATFSVNTLSMYGTIRARRVD